MNTPSKLLKRSIYVILWPLLTLLEAVAWILQRLPEIKLSKDVSFLEEMEERNREARMNPDSFYGQLHDPFGINSNKSRNDYEMNYYDDLNRHRNHFKDW